MYYGFHLERMDKVKRGGVCGIVHANKVAVVYEGMDRRKQ